MPSFKKRLIVEQFQGNYLNFGEDLSDCPILDFVSEPLYLGRVGGEASN